MARTAPRILVSERQRRILDKLERSHKIPQQLVPRVQIVKLSGQGVPNNEQAVELEIGTRGDRPMATPVAESPG
ncbi:hypothetical protein SAMN02745121_08353 [Nannocystis exedens]|uniref:Uncharacterized protein n=1 Tax=Nannocystis exedens TaxID=54 RepID=A0A1I2I547_9BACT|nr:hypothetical protein [Nannocystis exedens]PCC73522.1 hypothetical protein NAEX_06610 [Nannocystis exedens]SFF35631.1 hypothetical protein SAMN02745121_08353 [Nannocystis exedens]